MSGFESLLEKVNERIEYLKKTQLNCVDPAFSFWVSKGLNVSAKNLSVYYVTFKVNGGHNGYDDRRIRFNKVAELLKINKD